jgi:predicted dehydrogenase
MVHVAVVGCGYWGPNLIRNLCSLSGCVVDGICDLDSDRLAHAARLYPGVRTTTDLRDFAGDPSIDAVILATPANTHYPLGRLFLEAGKHTLIEKPLARTSAQCEELIELARRKSVTLMVDHTFVYNPAVRAIRDVVAAGTLGEILYMSSRRLNLGLCQKDINVAWDLAPHDISIMLYALGESPVAVNCQGAAHFSPGVEDVATIALYFASRAFGVIQASWLDPRKVRETTIVGTRRMLVYDDTESLEKVRIYDKRVEAPPHYDTFAEFHYSYHYGDISIPFIKQGEPLRAECEHFVECIETGRTPDSPGEQGLEVVRVLEAASESLRRGGAMVRVDQGTEGLDARRSA